MGKDEGPIRFFPTPREWRRWLERNHARAADLWVGFHKTTSGKPSITWPEAVDQALCFGWIDGKRQRIDATSYKIRFTPRKPTSKWSAINIARVKRLSEDGLMRAAGRKAFEARKAKASGVYSYEQRHTAKLQPELQKKLEANAEAWAFFQSMAPWYRRTAVFWVVSAKQEATRLRRLEALISDSARGRTIGPLTRPK